jgi:hypothetical protein
MSALFDYRPPIRSNAPSIIRRSPPDGRSSKSAPLGADPARMPGAATIQRYRRSHAPADTYPRAERAWHLQIANG